MEQLRHISLKDYTYKLPETRIALRPLDKRDTSKLLVYKKGAISHQHFYHIHQNLPAQSLLVFNDTKVIPARLFVRRATGALIEILLLNAVQPAEVHRAMESQGNCTWKCIIGRKKRWKKGEILQRSFEWNQQQVSLEIDLVDPEENCVQFRWEPAYIPWVNIVEYLGEIPLPPYIKRKPTEADKEQYQTVYAKQEGAVAAPTAGLHFTTDVLNKLSSSGFSLDYVTLHVGAGTFLPIKSDQVYEHDMHSEQIIIKKSNIRQLLKHEGKIIAVGTTSMRVLESLYWIGVQFMDHSKKESPSSFIKVSKLEPYSTTEDKLPTTNSALQAILNHMDKNELDMLWGETSIFIMPGYSFKVCTGLITNFHMPGTTLLLLIAAFVGENWKRIYEEALQNAYRFLSYGDSSLLLPD